MKPSNDTITGHVDHGLTSAMSKPPVPYDWNAPHEVAHDVTHGQCTACSLTVGVVGGFIPAKCSACGGVVAPVAGVPVPVACRFGVAGCDNTCHGDHNTERMFADLRANATPPVPEALPELDDNELNEIATYRSFERTGGTLKYSQRLALALADRLDARERENTELQQKLAATEEAWGFARVAHQLAARERDALRDNLDATDAALVDEQARNRELTARAEQAERERDEARKQIATINALAGEPVAYVPTYLTGSSEPMDETTRQQVRDALLAKSSSRGSADHA